MLSTGASPHGSIALDEEVEGQTGAAADLPAGQGSNPTARLGCRRQLEVEMGLLQKNKQTAGWVHVDHLPSALL